MSADANPGFSRRGLSGNHRMVRSQNNTQLPPTPFRTSSPYAASENMSSPTLLTSGAPGAQEQPIHTVDWSVKPLRIDGARPLHGWRHQVQETLSDQVTPIRLLGHLSVLLVAAGILLVSQVDIPEWNLPIASNVAAGAQVAEFVPVSAPVSAEQPAGDEAASEVILANAVSDSSLQKAAVPLTIIPDRGRKSIENYVVEPGDTVLGIAHKFGLNPETLMWSNSSLEDNADLLRIGDELNILPLDGAIHTVVSGDTLSSLAAKYKVEISDIIGYEANQLADTTSALTLGKQLIIPNGTKPYIAKQVVAFSGPIPAGASVGTGYFAWPISGNLTQNYWGGHRAWISARIPAPL